MIKFGVDWPDNCPVCGIKITWLKGSELPSSTKCWQYCRVAGFASGHYGAKMFEEGKVYVALSQDDDAITLDIPIIINHPDDLKRWIKLQAFL